ncbi:DUF4192 domain-containing protein [Nocardia sp. CA-128927]|uniref:DUF4192 domain-containing protein n=1 Tax=Nocardia sp. CA-128927 TaxID=3239975 RepID=UPI003D986F78
MTDGVGSHGDAARVEGEASSDDIGRSDDVTQLDETARLGDTTLPDSVGRSGDSEQLGYSAWRYGAGQIADIDECDAAEFSDGSERIDESVSTDFDDAEERGAFSVADHVRTLVCADQAPPFDADAPDCAVCVDEPGEIIAAVPAMIGFPPERSLVVLVLRSSPGRSDGAIIDAVVRFDMEQDGGRRKLRAGMVAQCVLQICAHDDVAEVLVVVVDDRAVEPARRRSEIGERCGTGRFEALIDALDRRLAAQDITLAGAWAVRSIEPEQSWWSLVGPDRRGALPDPATSVVALSHVLDGRQIRGSRSELTELVAEDVEVRDQVAAVLDSALSVARDRYARAVRRGDPSDYSRQALDYVLWQIANTESGVQLMVPELAELAAALRDRAVRDAMFALAVGDHAVAAEGLWAALTRALTGRDRAEAAALLGYSAYVRGDGPLAGIALEAALDADPDHPLATLLETSLMIGMRPDQLRRLARSGYDTAADLGIDLGSPTP